MPPLEYPGHFLVKRVTNAGPFRLKHRLLSLRLNLVRIDCESLGHGQVNGRC